MNICIVEDNAPLLANLQMLLDGEADIDVIACHTSAEEAFRNVDWKTIDVLLADIDLPHMSGIDLIRGVHPQNPHMSILVYTVHEDRSSVLEAIRAGACGYLIKGSTPHELIAALRQIHAGGAPMSPKIARSVLTELRKDEAEPDIPEDQQLTVREITIMRYLEEGHSYKEIATELGVSPHTVHTHIKNTYQKLQAHSRVEAIRKGRIRGVL